MHSENPPGRILKSGLAVVAAITLLAGCVTYPAITEIGGARIRPENGRLVRQPDGAALYVDLHSTGKFGDAIVAVQAPIAGQVALVGDGGGTVARVEIPGAALVLLRPGGPHVRLEGLTRALAPGEVVIVTLVFEKLGRLGVVSVVE